MGRGRHEREEGDTSGTAVFYIIIMSSVHYYVSYMRIMILLLMTLSFHLSILMVYYIH